VLPRTFGDAFISIEGVVTLWEIIYRELRAVPVTMILLATLYIMVAQLEHDHVSAKDFQALQQEIHGIQDTLLADHRDSRIHQAETELFNLTQHVSEERAHGHEVDPLYDSRINDLKNELKSYGRINP
jgi:hypothetical protein